MYLHVLRCTAAHFDSFGKTGEFPLIYKEKPPRFGAALVVEVRRIDFFCGKSSSRL